MCAILFDRWRKGHSKKSPRSKSPATVEHNRALENVQRSHRRHQLPRAVSTVTARTMPKNALAQHSCLQCAQQLFHLSSAAISQCSRITMLLLQAGKLISQSGEVTHTKLTQCLSAGHRI